MTEFPPKRAGLTVKVAVFARLPVYLISRYVVDGLKVLLKPMFTLIVMLPLRVRLLVTTISSLTPPPSVAAVARSKRLVFPFKVRLPLMVIVPAVSLPPGTKVEPEAAITVLAPALIVPVLVTTRVWPAFKLKLPASPVRSKVQPEPTDMVALGLVMVGVLAKIRFAPLTLMFALAREAELLNIKEPPERIVFPV